MLRFVFTLVPQALLALTFLVIPLSRMVGAPTLKQVLALGVPLWLVWIANVIELSGAVLLLVGLRVPVCATLGALLIAASMVGATLAHLRAGTLFAHMPWELVFLACCLVVVVFQVPALS